MPFSLFAIAIVLLGYVAGGLVGALIALLVLVLIAGAGFTTR